MDRIYRVAQHGKTFHAVINYEPAGIEVVLGALKTKDRFASDYTE